MESKESILIGKYVLAGFVFSNETTEPTAKKLIELINSRERIVLDYGDIKTKESWNETFDVTGRVGYCKGFYDLKYPILVHNARSFGGGTILTACILSIKTSKGKKLIFEHK